MNKDVTNADTPQIEPVADDLPALPEARVAVLNERRDDVRRQLSAILPTGPSRFLWEVGCGHGHFLTAYAQVHPEKLCVGVDIASDRIARATKKRDRAKLANLSFIRTEARLFLEAIPAEARISEVFILFPDPWPKSRHHKHRVLQLEFLAEVAGHSLPDSQIYFRTDYHPYFLDAEATTRQSPYWRVVEAAWPFEFETVFQSRAEQHYSFIAVRR